MRRVTERLEGYAFAVALQPPTNGNAHVVGAEVHLVDDPKNPSHVVVIPLSPEGRERLVAQLTGGIVLGAPAAG